MFLMYIESRAQISFIELYVEFEQSEADRNIVREDYNSDSEEEFESNYEVVGPDGDEDKGDGTMAPNVMDVANTLANEVPFEEPSFMRVLDLDAMHVPEFSEYMSAEIPIVADGEFSVGIEFSSRKVVIKTMKEATISQDHSKLDSITIAEAIKSLVEADPLLKVKSVIAEVQLKFNYTVNYRKAWLAKQKAVEKIYGCWEVSYEALPIWFEVMCYKEPSVVVYFETMPAYQGDDLVTDIRVLHRVFWSYYPYIRAFRHCKPIVQVDGTHLYGKYKGCLLVAVLQDDNNNIVPIAFVIVEGETSDVWRFFLNNLRQHVVTRDGVGLISDRHESINAAVACSNGAWEPPRAFHIFCIRHIESNFLRKFKYALAFDGGYRWGHMTTNLVECINSVLKGARNLPMTALVKTTFYRLNELFTQKRAEAKARINARHNEIFEVREMPSELEYAVDNDVTVESSRWTRFLVDMSFHVVQINDWIDKPMCKMCDVGNVGAEGHSRSRCCQIAGANADGDAQ
ncbi:hypothetical protein Ahy_A03g015659 [Arachis hypogaea]|uniref:MULE transposase domain-containing protein n=1 Tax=Arachis hypogaea TaxID=3818 RepID=A0A445E119_ARAHY|nr:hypothetical protein Ahy_A03g015659 [Arachis hypogaea]